MVFFILLDKSLEHSYNNHMKNTDEDDDFDFSWATNFSKKMTKFGEKMNKLGKDLTESSSTLFDGFDGLIQNCSIQGDIVGGTSVITKNGKTTIKKGNTKITIDKDGNVTVNGKKVEKEKEEEKKPKPGHLEKLPDIPKVDDSDLFKNTIPTKVCVHENLTTPLTLAHLDKYELELTKLESKLGGRIEKLFMAVVVIGVIALTTLFLFCMNS